MILTSSGALAALGDVSWVDRVVDLSEVVDKPSVIAAFAEGLDFPDYFELNWDSFDECVHDLEWLRPGPVRVLLSGSRAILGLRTSTLVVLAQILLREDAEYERGVVWMLVDDEEALQVLRSAGAAP